MSETTTPAPPPTSLSSKQKELLHEEILKRVEDMIASLGTHGSRCERCGHVHASVERAIRYHMARYWVMPLAEQYEEMAFIESLRLALPPGVNVTVKLSEAKRILKEGG